MQEGCCIWKQVPLTLALILVCPMRLQITGAVEDA